MASYADRVKMTTPTTGTGDVDIDSGTAIPGYRRFDDAGFYGGERFSYLIEDGLAWEVGWAVSFTITITRNMTSSSTGSLLNLSGNAIISLTLSAADMVSMNWSVIPKPTFNDIRTDISLNTIMTDITFGNGIYLIVSSGTASATSPDGITWTARTIPVGFSNVIYTNNKFIGIPASGTTGYTSPDGITWTARTIPASGGSWSNLAYNFVTHTTVMVTSGTTAAYTTDGITWTTATLPASSNWNYVYRGTFNFYAFSSTSGTVAAQSSDGITWSSLTMPVSAVWNSMTTTNYGVVVASTTTNITGIMSASRGATTFVAATSPFPFGMKNLTAVATNTSFQATFALVPSGTVGGYPFSSPYLAMTIDGLSWETIPIYSSIGFPIKIATDSQHNMVVIGGSYVAAVSAP